MRTRYCNIDLDLASAQPLDTLTTALENAELHRINEWKDDAGHEYQGWEVNGLLDFEGPAPAIELLLAAIEGLSENARAIWNACESRAFDIGYNCGEEPWGFHQEVPVELLARMAALNISLRLTLYPEHPPGHKKKQSS